MKQTLLCIAVNILLIITYWCLCTFVYSPKGSDDMLGVFYLIAMILAHMLIAAIGGVGFRISGNERLSKYFYLSAILPLILIVILFLLDEIWP